MQNNLNKPVFNPNDDTTWRWNDPALENTIISESEARQIRQTARHLGGEFTLLHTEGSSILPCLIDHSLNETQQLLARRAAIIITAQQTHDIPIRNERQAIDAHRQINNFFEGFNNNLVLHPRQADLIHKTIDSSFAVREFRKGRLILDSNIPSQKNLQKRTEISEAALIHFFKYMVEDIPYGIVQNRYDYLRVDLQTPLQNIGNTYVFIRKAFDYLVQMYNGINPNSLENRPILMLLNRLINNEAVTGTIKNAIIKNISASKLGASLKHLQDITEEEAVSYINFLSGLVSGLGLSMTHQILDFEKGIIAIFNISKTNIRIENLCYAITIATNKGAPSRLKDINAIIDYIQLVSNLINAPSSQAVDAGCLNALLDFQEGALALSASRIEGFPMFENKDATMLAKSLHIAIRAPDNPADNKEDQAAYINLMTEVINQYLYNTTSYARIVKLGWAMVFGIEDRYAVPENFIKEFFKNKNVSVVFNKARVVGLNANSIVHIMGNSENTQSSLLLLSFVLDIIGTNIQNVSVQTMNDFIGQQNETMHILNKACNIRLNASSVARLISCSNNHNDYIANLKLVIDLIEPQNQAAIHLGVDAINRYLALDGSSERMNADRKQKIPRERIINTINQTNQAQQQIKDAAMQERITMLTNVPASVRIVLFNTYSPEIREQVLAKLPAEIRNSILTNLNNQN